MSEKKFIWRIEKERRVPTYSGLIPLGRWCLDAVLMFEDGQATLTVGHDMTIEAPDFLVSRFEAQSVEAAKVIAAQQIKQALSQAVAAMSIE